MRGVKDFRKEERVEGQQRRRLMTMEKRWMRKREKEV